MNPEEQLDDIHDIIDMIFTQGWNAALSKKKFPEKEYLDQEAKEIQALVDKAVVAARIDEANYYLANRDFTRMIVGKSVIKDRLNKLKAIMEIKES